MGFHQKISSQTEKNRKTAARAAKFARFAKIAGKTMLIIGGAFDIGYGGYAYYTTHQRYLAGELDWDITLAKKALAVGHIVNGGILITARILLMMPEPVLSKIAGVVLIGVGVAYVIIDYFLDAYLERLQAKRNEQRKRLLAKISWDARRSVCIDQLRKMIQQPL